MKKNMLSAIFAASLLASTTQSVLAESVAVEGDSIFILDNSVSGSQIVVKNLNTGAPNSCLATAGSNLLALPDGTQATDILIKKGTAVITTYNDTTLVTDIKLVDVASCPLTSTVDLSECYATVEDGKLTIPCLEYGSDIISVVLRQRGSSMNFEFESYKPKGR